MRSGAGPGPVSRRWPWVMAVIGLVLLALLGWVVAGPWLAIRGIEQALAGRDTAALSRHVDFPTLRLNLKAQVQDRIVRRAGEDLTRHPLGVLAVAATGQAASAAVDLAASPAGVAGLLQGHALFQRARGRTEGGDTWAAAEPARPLRQARLRYQSLSRFTATIDHADGGSTVCVLERKGLRWRLVDIRLPEDLSAWLR
jgi:hypothetical protein